VSAPHVRRVFGSMQASEDVILGEWRATGAPTKQNRLQGECVGCQRPERESGRRYLAAFERGLDNRKWR